MKNKIVVDIQLDNGVYSTRVAPAESHMRQIWSEFQTQDLGSKPTPNATPPTPWWVSK